MSPRNRKRSRVVALLLLLHAPHKNDTCARERVRFAFCLCRVLRSEEIRFFDRRDVIHGIIFSGELEGVRVFQWRVFYC